MPVRIVRPLELFPFSVIRNSILIVFVFILLVLCWEPYHLVSKHLILRLMATKKMEGRIETMKEQITGEMTSIKGELQRLGPLEVKVDSMLEKLLLLERMDKVLQRWENPKRASSLEEEKDQNTNPKDPNFRVVATMPKESSIGA